MADQNLRVALMTREYPPHVYGGAGVHVEYLSRELAKSIAVDVHCWGSPEDQHSPDANPRVIPHQPAAEIANAPDAKFKAALEAFSINLAEVANLNGSSEFKPTDLAHIDLVHTHTWYVSMAGFLAKMLYGIPFVLTTHSLEPLRAWKAEQLGTGYALSSWMERTAILAADAVIAVSQGTRSDILRAYPTIDPARIHVIYNGIDLNQYRRTADTTALTTYGVDPTRPYILFVGRITRQKGVTHLVDAIQHLPPDTQVVLCAGAPDTPEIASEMRAKVEAARAHRRQAAPPLNTVILSERSESKDLRLQTERSDVQEDHQNIIWIEKMVTKEETIQLYSHCRVFCCPSVYEPFGIINLEAMACEAPVVASATGGILEVVVDPEHPLPQSVILSDPQSAHPPATVILSDPERASRAEGESKDLRSSPATEPQTGYLVPFTADPTTGFPTNPEQFAKDLAAKLAILLNDEQKARQLGQAGRKRAEQHFSWTTIAQQTIALYRSLLPEL